MNSKNSIIYWIISKQTRFNYILICAQIQPLRSITISKSCIFFCVFSEFSVIKRTGASLKVEFQRRCEPIWKKIQCHPFLTFSNFILWHKFGEFSEVTSVLITLAKEPIITNNILIRTVLKILSAVLRISLDCFKTSRAKTNALEGNKTFSQ